MDIVITATDNKSDGISPPWNSLARLPFLHFSIPGFFTEVDDYE